MQKKATFCGVIAPVLTPFGEDGGPDAERFVEHCQWLMATGCTALAPFGTTSEGNSLGLDERMELLEELVDTGELDPAKLMPGTGTCALSDAVVLTKHAVDLGCGGVLMLPPFYYKAPSEEGLFRFFAEVIEEVADDRLKIYLYHIPPVAQVGFSLSLVGRLIKAFPDTVVGLKDSSGDWNNTAALLAAYPGFEVFPGSEVFLLDGLRKAIQAFAMIPALKALIAHYRQDPAWAKLRPPFVGLPTADADKVIRTLAEAHGFRLDFAQAA